MIDLSYLRNGPIRVDENNHIFAKPAHYLGEVFCTRTKCLREASFMKRWRLEIQSPRLDDPFGLAPSCGLLSSRVPWWPRVPCDRIPHIVWVYVYLPVLRKSLRFHPGIPTPIILITFPNSTSINTTGDSISNILYNWHMPPWIWGRDNWHASMDDVGDIWAIETRGGKSDIASMHVKPRLWTTESRQ